MPPPTLPENLQIPLPHFPHDPESVRGFLHPNEGRALYHLAQLAPPELPAMEIGSYCGKSTLYLGYGCRHAERILYTLDHHRGSEEQQPGEEFHDPELLDPRSEQMDTLPELRRNLEQAQLLDSVVPMIARSRVAAQGWGGLLALLFIDGGHSFADASTDYRLWVPKLVPEGYLAIHDVFPNPKDGGQAPVTLLRRALTAGEFEQIAQIHSLAILRRR